jgi:hypothetical protein
VTCSYYFAARRSYRNLRPTPATRTAVTSQSKPEGPARHTPPPGGCFHTISYTGTGAAWGSAHNGTAAAYGRFVAAPSQADLERVFFLDDEDRKLLDLRRGEHMKAGFALQLVTVRWLGTFLENPLDVPGEVLDFVAGQLGIADSSVVKQYAERVKTKSDHQQEIRRKYGLRGFADAEAELAGWVAARAGTARRRSSWMR